MSRGTEYKFVDTDSTQVVSDLIAQYENITGHTLQPADPDRLFLSWVADVIIYSRVNQNYIGNQNIPSRAEGKNLDALGEWIYSLKRRAAQAAKCTVRFYISEAQSTSISIPTGTRVSDVSQNLVWYTTEDALIEIGETFADVPVQCEKVGTIGNRYAAGQINKLIDVDNILYYSSCKNITESDGGAEEDDDDTYFEAMRAIGDSYSTAGSEGSYVYWAKSVSNEIADVKAICPYLKRQETLPVYYDSDGNGFAFVGGDQINVDTLQIYTDSFLTPLDTKNYTVEYTNGLLTIKLKDAKSTAVDGKIGIKAMQRRAGYVYLYALMSDGSVANETIKDAIYERCSARDVRPLTDCVVMNDPDVITYNIDCTYYISEDTQMTLSEIETAVSNAVDEYKKWQCAKLGRDINPDKLKLLIMQAGVKRVVIKSPTFISLHSGADDSVPQIAKVGEITVTNGGYEDE